MTWWIHLRHTPECLWDDLGAQGLISSAVPAQNDSRKEFALSLTDRAIEQIRGLIRAGAQPPGAKLPPGTGTRRAAGIVPQPGPRSRQGAGRRSRTLRARIWRGPVGDRPTGRALAAHQAVPINLPNREVAAAALAVHRIRSATGPGDGERLSPRTAPRRVAETVPDRRRK